MADETLFEMVLALPLEKRVELAEALWESIGDSSAAPEESDAVKEALRRDAEMTSDQVVGRSHEEVMRSARRAIGCD